MVANPSRQRVLPGLALAQTAKRKLTCPGFAAGAFFRTSKKTAPALDRGRKVHVHIEVSDYRSTLGHNSHAWSLVPFE